MAGYKKLDAVIDTVGEESQAASGAFKRSSDILFNSLS